MKTEVDNWQNRKPGSDIIAATGKPKGICGNCRKVGRPSYSAKGIIIEVAKEGLLLIAGLVVG